MMLIRYIMLFFIYSIIGFFVETIFCWIKTKKIMDRGFLIGPYLPIYGFGALISIIYLTQYKENIFTVFLLGMIICSTLEYVTSFIMEKMFKARWWDYTNKPFNLNGRICGENSLLFGIASVLVIYLSEPLFDKLLNKINTTLLFFITIILAIILVIDLIMSFNVITKVRKTITNLEIRKDSTNEISKLVKETIINNNKFLQKRLLSAFPDIKININKIKENLEKDIKELINKENH